MIRSFDSEDTSFDEVLECEREAGKVVVAAAVASDEPLEVGGYTDAEWGITMLVSGPGWGHQDASVATPPRVAVGAGPEQEVSASPRSRYLRPRRGTSRKMAAALAYEAYFQFGHRERSEANLMITRKFMRDKLSELKDMRAKDAALIVDGALYLSFLPSLTLQDMNAMDGTSAFADRSADVKPGWRWWPFGHGRRHAVRRA